MACPSHNPRSSRNAYPRGGPARYRIHIDYLKDGHKIRSEVADTASSLGEAQKYFDRAIRLGFYYPELGQDTIWVHMMDQGKQIKFKEVKRNPLFLPKSLFDSYIVKSDDNEVSVDKIQTLAGAEKKVRELARKYPCVGFSILSAKHGSVIKKYDAAVGKTPKVSEDNSRQYKQTATKEAKQELQYSLYVSGDWIADYDTEAEAKEQGRRIVKKDGGSWKVKVKKPNPLTGSPSRDIPKLRHEGYGQRQAEAIAMKEQRRHENPQPQFFHIGVFDIRKKRASDGTYTWNVYKDSELVYVGVSYGDAAAYAHNRSRSKNSENPLSIFPTRRAALAFASRTPGSSVFPAGTDGYVVRYPIGRGRRNPEPGTLPKVHYGLSQSNASYNRSQAMKALKAGMAPEEIHKEWPRVWGIDNGKLFQHYDAEFAGHPGVYETKVSMANVPEIIARYKKTKKGKRNPDNSLSSAESLYESFHGEASDGETEYVETVEIPDRFVELGDLIELKVATLHGKDVTISAPDPDRFDVHEIVKLASSPDGCQLYFIGGDESLQLDKLGFKNNEIKPHMVIGVLYELTYRTRKGFDKFKLTDYYHATGEDTGNQPMLTYDHTNGLMAIVGGEYKVKDVGIVN